MVEGPRAPADFRDSTQLVLGNLRDIPRRKRRLRGPAAGINGAVIIAVDIERFAIVLTRNGPDLFLVFIHKSSQTTNWSAATHLRAVKDFTLFQPIRIRTMPLEYGHLRLSSHCR